MQLKKISFIITIYKVEPYLRQCVESISSQSYSNIEIILVDDGSPDNAPSLCDIFAKEDERIRVIHKKNGGASDARNQGLLSATGDYLVFVDGDDFWLGNHYLQDLVNVIEDNPGVDFVGFNCKYYYSSEERYTKWAEFPYTIQKPINKDEALVQLAHSGIFPVSACMKIIKRNLVEKYQLFFPVGQTAEDIPWFINLMDSCDNCLFVNYYIYSYRQVQNSSSVTHTVGIKSVNCLIQTIDNEIALLPKRSFNKEAKDSLLSFLAYELIQTYTCIPYLSKQEARLVYNRLKNYGWLFDYTQNPKVKIVNSIRQLLGINLTMRIVNLYLKLRR